MTGGPGRRVWIEDVEEEVALFEADHFGSLVRSGDNGGCKKMLQVV